MELETLKGKRGGHRASAKRILGSVDKLLDQQFIESGELRALGIKLEEKLCVLAKLDEQIVDLLVTAEEISIEIETADQRNLEISTRIEQIKKKEVELSRESATHQGARSDVLPGNPSGKNFTANLPKLTLGKFFGEPMEYRTFFEQFDAAVGETDLPKVEKFTYLKSLLGGEASRSISGMAVSGDNYESAREILHSRFGDTQVLINSLMGEFVNIEPVRALHDGKKLRFFYDRVEGALRSLEAIGVSSEMYGSLLVPMLLEKLPEEIRLVVNRAVGNNGRQWTVKELQKQLEIELTAREKSGVRFNQQSRENKSTWGHQRGQTKFGTTEALFNEGAKINCQLCDGAHFADQCATYKDFDARKSRIAQKKLCFICLRNNHIAKNCRGGRKCRTCGKQNHHTAICKDKQTKEVASEYSANVAGIKQTNIIMQSALVSAQDTENKYRATCRVLFDSASQRTYVREKTAKTLRLERRRKELLVINTFGNNTAEAAERDIVRIKLTKGKGEAFVDAIVVKDLCAPLTGQSLTPELFESLRGFDLADTYCENNEQKQIDVLVGLDFYYKIISGQINRHKSGLVVVSSIFGGILAGETGTVCAGETSKTALFTHTYGVGVEPVHDELAAALNRFWDVESLSVSNEGKVAVPDRVCASHNGDRYEVGLPWLEENPLLYDNYANANARLSSLKKKLTRDKDLGKTYSEIIRGQEKDGVIERVSTKDPINGRVYYMPHKAVVKNESSTTKVRVVFDASARHRGISLNDCLDKGMSKFTDLFGVLIRFRCHRHVILADIEKAFLTVAVREKDRDVLRFLFWDDLNKQNPQTIIYRYARVVFGVNASMALLGEAIETHLNKYKSTEPGLVSKIEQGLYVDDFSSGGDTKQEIIHIYRRSKEIFANASMNLRKWRTNLKEIRLEIESDGNAANTERTPLNSIAEDERSFAEASLSQQDFGGEKVLGVSWESDKDTFIFDLKKIGEKGLKEVKSKRDLLALTASIFDPLGVLAPVILPLKVMFQKICQHGTLWDADVPEELINNLRKWCQAAAKMRPIEIQRNFVPPKNEITRLQLVGFSDASESAYAAVVYVVSENKRGEKMSRFCTAKSRVAPLAKQTIPRLELLGAVILSRMINRLREIIGNLIEINEVVCCTDSQVTLTWIKNASGQYKQYVQGRVNEIRANTGKEVWFHVPGKENPADLPSRGCTVEALEIESWSHGPDWLTTSRDEWPLTSGEGLTSGTEELKTNKVAVFKVATENTGCISTLIDLANFSNVGRLLRVTGWVLRFINRLRQRCFQPETELSASELKISENMWLRCVQKELKADPKFEQVKKSLGVFDSNGLLRCGGRLKHADIPFDTKHPILLPQKHTLTELLVRKAHVEVFHNGVKETLTQLRSKFWVIKGRQSVKSIVSRCVVCRKLEGLAYGVPEMAPLPECRVKGGTSFDAVGTDFCGPCYVRSNSSQIVKCYVNIITCAASRMVHLEVVNDLSTPALIRGLKRFFARRGHPSLIISDNAKTFKAQQLKQFLAGKGILWRYNLAKAPWWGGMFERLIRSTKRCLKKLFSNAKLTYEELNTVIIEIEGVLNSRPLTYVDAEGGEILTPSHLHLGKRLLDPPGEPTEPVEFDESDARAEVKRVEAVIQRFWETWKKEYLTSLRENSTINGRMGQRPEIGDVVIIHQDDKRRHLWKLGRVVKLLANSEGVVRGAKVRVHEQGKRAVEIDRPLQKLFPLEMRDQGRGRKIELVQEDDTPRSTDSNTKNQRDVASSEMAQTGSVRPQRKAAQAGVEKRRLAQIIAEEI